MVDAVMLGNKLIGGGGAFHNGPLVHSKILLHPLFFQFLCEVFCCIIKLFPSNRLLPEKVVGKKRKVIEQKNKRDQMHHPRGN